MLRRRVAVLAFLVLLVPSSAASQSQMQIALSAFGGTMIPSNDLILFLSTEPIAFFNFSQEVGWTVGGRLSFWPSSKIGIEAEGSFVGNSIKQLAVTPDTVIDQTANASLFLGSLSVQYAFFAPPLEPVSMYVSGGIGLVSRGGDAFRGLGSSTTTDLAGVIGLGLRYGLAPGFRIRFDAKDYISKFKHEEIDELLAPLGGVESKLQNDIALTAGVEFFFNPGQ